ncbi:hypothetical protein [Metabacillus arenae]|uniref:Uncharacterized protein n=1 Tax=Metabacillus arenae TaxID=2771434 RepID=A0A926RZV7_9BACI|nr:hypothetical protein [Metabacillus arenae]MBD1379429.1 hypothetical protein [Metabacillus arenae]
MQSTQIGDTDPIISVSVYDDGDITEVENYLESNLSEGDLDNYKLNVYQYSSDPLGFRDNERENLDLD